MRHQDRLLDGTNFQRRKATADTKRKVKGWDEWECTDATFQHDYDRKVTMFVQEGSATLTFGDGEMVDIEAGDTLTIQPGVSASWNIAPPIRNLYCYHDTFTSAENRVAQVNWHGKQA
ncbi:cupin domain-containing protein [Tritonibacter scottomollicae]|uniref:Uncharacterized protein DUF861 n=1 Tax=Tritonibacter scottomollicae TaxID=483013 RepID=A0A2T1A8D6_TRISK|nr:cupin domain-containing protein [Tritonibacter scottomollicae]PRZ44608.1 uncharacterized protein DUF861 [Tritonibacter scottomollicae]